MATTTNYSWTTPDDTDLVKDGASAIRSLGSAIDSTVFTNAGNAVQKSTIDAKGDLLVGTADNTITRLAVGTNNYVLTADSAEATGVKWAAAATSSGPAFQATLTNAQTLNQSTTTTIAFDAENFDTASCFNTTNYRFTPNQAGYYWIYGQIFLAQGNAARMIVTIDKNGSEYCRLFDLNTSPNVEWYFNGGITMYLNGTTDYVTMTAWLGGTATRQVVNTSTNNRTRFEGYFIRS